MFRKIAILCLLVFSASLSIFGESFTYSFLRYNTSARSLAMGNTFESIKDDASALIYNPSSINTITQKPIHLTFTKNILDINSGNISYVRNFDKIGYVAAHIVYSNFGSFDKYDNTGANIGTFGANDFVFGLSYGNELDSNLYYGITLKYIFSGISEFSSSALAFDAGLQYYLDDNRTSFGLSVLNAGFQIASYNGEKENLPLDVRIGASHRLIGLPLLAAISFHHLADETDNIGEKFLGFSVGGEIYIGKYVNLRLGYDNKVRKNTAPDSEKKLSGLSAGLGIVTKNFNFDYGIAQLGASFLIHKFSFSLQI